MRWCFAPFFVLLVLGASICGASSLGAPNELESGGFESGWTGWTTSGSPELVTTGWYQEAGPHTGDYAAGVHGNLALAEGTLSQTVTVAEAGVYNVDLSFWAWLFDNAEPELYPSSVEVSLEADGITVSTLTVSTDEPGFQQGTYLYNELLWSVLVESSLTVRVHMLADGRNGDGWAVVAVDDVDLELALTEAGPVVYVAADAAPGGNGTSWAGAFKTIGEGLAAAATFQEIWVKKGTYSETITLKDYVCLYGGFAGTETQRTQRNPASNLTTINGGGAGPVVTAASHLTLDGFTVKSGAAVSGAGIYALLETGLTISNNTIKSNAATESGGGISMSNCADAVLSGNRLESNSSPLGGGVYANMCTGLSVSDNVFTLNSSHEGGGIHLDFSTGSLSRNDFISNSSDGGLGAGFYAINGSSALVLEDCLFEGNTNPGTASHGGAVALANAHIVVRRCLIRDNVGGLGAGVYCLMSSPTVEKCTIVDNSGNQGTGVWASNGSSPTVKNCIIAQNSPEGVRSVSGTGTLVYNDVWGNGTNYVGITPGAGSISLDPLFIDPDGGCFRLDWGSPCVNAGTSDGVNPDGVTELGASPAVVVPGDAATITAALSASAGYRFGATVHVKQGIYNENLVIPANVDCIGVGAGLTILDLLDVGTGVKATAGGRSYIKGITVRNAGAGGFYLENGWYAVIACEVLDCQPYPSAQGGISFIYASGLVTRCYLARNGHVNYWGGGIGCVYSNPDIRDNLIEDNISWGGGAISLYKSSPVIANNTMRRNKGGAGAAIACVYYSNPAITNNVFEDNIGTAVYEHPHLGASNIPVLTNNLFWGNTKGHYSNCMGEYNVILYTAAEIDALNPPGTNQGTIVADPLLLDSGRITPGSPCLEGGSATGSPGPDIFGVARPVDGDGNGTASTDIGAHEYLSGEEPFSAVVKWNLICLPLLPPDCEVSAVLGGLGIPLTGAVYQYGSTGYATYPNNFTLMQPGRGYWLRTTSAASTNIPGELIRGRFEIDLTQKWNMIGSPRDGAVAISSLYLRSGTAVKSWSEAVAAGWVGNVLYRYDQGAGYIAVGLGQPENTLLPGTGYWLCRYGAEELSLIFP